MSIFCNWDLGCTDGLFSWKFNCELTSLVFFQAILFCESIDFFNDRDIVGFFIFVSLITDLCQGILCNSSGSFMLPSLLPTISAALLSLSHWGELCLWSDCITNFVILRSEVTLFNNVRSDPNKFDYREGELFNHFSTSSFDFIKLADS